MCSHHPGWSELMGFPSSLATRGRGPQQEVTKMAKKGKDPKDDPRAPSVRKMVRGEKLTPKEQAEVNEVIKEIREEEQGKQ